MQLHEHLAALAQRLGPGVFDDPDGLRGALDDFLDEDAATTGEINLIVDAVRIGAYRSMLGMLDSGAGGSAAVEEAGARLARDRGSSDVDGARWAVAALGFAVGRVASGDVERYGHQRGTGAVPHAGQAGQAGAPSAVRDTSGQTPAQPWGPPQPPQQSPAAPWGPPQSSPQQPPQQSPQQPPQQSPAPGWGPPGQSPAASWQQSPAPYPPGPHGAPPKKKHTGVILAVVGTLLAAGLAVVLVLTLTGGDDEVEEAGDPNTSAPVSSEPATDPTSPDSPTSPAEPTTDETSESDPDPGGSGGISTEDALAFASAAGDFGQTFQTATTALTDATSANDTPAARAAVRDMRATFVDLDTAMRGIDFGSAQPEANEALTQIGAMVTGLDELNDSAESAIDLSLGFTDLPVLEFSNAFTELGSAMEVG